MKSAAAASLTGRAQGCCLPEGSSGDGERFAVQPHFRGQPMLLLSGPFLAHIPVQLHLAVPCNLSKSGVFSSIFIPASHCMQPSHKHRCMQTDRDAPKPNLSSSWTAAGCRTASEGKTPCAASCPMKPAGLCWWAGSTQHPLAQDSRSAGTEQTGTRLQPAAAALRFSGKYVQVTASCCICLSWHSLFQPW